MGVRLNRLDASRSDPFELRPAAAFGNSLADSVSIRFLLDGASTGPRASGDVRSEPHPPRSGKKECSDGRRGLAPARGSAAGLAVARLCNSIHS